MAAQAALTLELSVTDAEGRIALVEPRKTWRWTPAVIKRETVSLTGAAFTALSPPTSAKAVILYPSTAVSLVLKGITGDSASITIAPASGPLQIPLILPLGASPVLGVLNNGSTVTVTVIWL